MKKVLLMFCAAILMITTSACTKNEYTITIDKNNSVTIDEVAAINLDGFISLAGSMGDDNMVSEIKNELESQMEETAAELKSNGYSVEKYDKDGYFGIAKNITYDNFETTKLPDGFTYKGDSFINVSNSLYKKNYKIDLVFNPKLYAESASNSSSQINTRKLNSMAATEPLPLMDSEVSDSNQRLAENLGIKPILSLTLKLPAKAKNTNATTKNDADRVYTWQLDLERDTRISIEYEQINTSNIIILFLAFFLLIGVAIYLHNKNEVPTGF